MGNPVVTNILKTGAVMWNAPSGEARPDETTIGYGDAWGGNWARLGYSKEPLAMSYESEEIEIEVEEVVGSVRRHRTKETVIFETVLAELIAEYLNKAAASQGTVSTTAAGASQKGYEEIDIGGKFTISDEAWGFEGLYVDADGNDQPVRIFVDKGTAMVNGNLEFSNKSDDYVGVPIQVKGLADTSNSDRMFTFQRVTADATS